MIEVNRIELLSALKTVASVADKKALRAQSDCVVFGEGQFLVNNGDAVCHITGPDCHFDGAVAAGPIVEMLSKLSEETVKVGESKGSFVVVGKKRRAKFTAEESVMVSTLSEMPKKWSKVPDGFKEAVLAVRPCVSTDRNNYVINCIHITDEWVEATNNSQLARSYVKVPIKGRCLVFADVLEKAVRMDMTHMATTQSWLHFKNDDGLVLSCRLYMNVNQFPRTDAVFALEGKPIELPQSMKLAVDRAEIFLRDSDGDKYVDVSIEDGKLTVKASGACGQYEEMEDVDSELSVQFSVSPDLIKSVLGKGSKCQLVEGQMLLVNKENFRYASALMIEA